MRGAAAIADALIGAYSPAGRSPLTFYASDAALPSDRGQMSPYPNASTNSPGLSYRFYDPAPFGLPPPVYTFGEGYSYTTFKFASNVSAPSVVGPCDSITVSLSVTNAGSALTAMDSDVVVAVYLSQTGLSVPAPRTRLVTFARAFVPLGQTVEITFPPIMPESRSVIHDTDNMFSLAGKRWNEAGTLQLRASLGGHGEDLVGGLAFQVQQTSSQDIGTC